MRILIALTYYRPHTSGLTIYVERLSQALAKRGHQVTILTSQFDRSLAKVEECRGVCILRVPVAFRISKGVIMPSFGWLATELVDQNDIVHLHLPQFDAAGIAMRGRLFNRPTVITYHCDLTLPPSPFNRFVNLVVNSMNHIAAMNADRIITYTQDFADNSPFLRRYAKKVNIILPPVILPANNSLSAEQFSNRYNIFSSPVIGMAARFAAEKGVEVLLDALPAMIKQFPSLLVLFAGQYENVLGEEKYARRLMPRIREFQARGHWKFLGVLNPSEMAAFYSNINALVVPSLNSTESFGLVQIEAMMKGVPIVASDLPGVRQPILMTGMGEIAQTGNSASLTEALLKVLSRPAHYRIDPEIIQKRFSPDVAATAYETLFGRLLGE